MRNITRVALPIAIGAIVAGLVLRRIQRNLRTQSLRGKTFVIIGASSGFGKGIALRLGEYGANIVLAARRTELLDDIAVKIQHSGGRATSFTLDISDKDELERLAEFAKNSYGNVDAWINNSGVFMVGKFWEIPIDEQDRLIDVNLKGILYATHTAVKLFIDQGYGTIINMGSIDSEIPTAYNSAYSATKAGVRSIGQSLNQELRLNGLNKIKVVTIHPWAVDTPLWQHAANYSGGTPRMAAMDPPRKVVDTVIKSLFTRPKEVPVGYKAKTFFHFHRLFPHTSERMTANIVHKYQFQDAPPADDTSGTLNEPMYAGTGIDDGVRQRIRWEDNNQ
jgi:short-subunit dehydrogenase